MSKLRKVHWNVQIKLVSNQLNRLIIKLGTIVFTLNTIHTKLPIIIYRNGNRCPVLYGDYRTDVLEFIHCTCTTFNHVLDTFPDQLAFHEQSFSKNNKLYQLYHKSDKSKMSRTIDFTRKKNEKWPLQKGNFFWHENQTCIKDSLSCKLHYPK